MIFSLKKGRHYDSIRASVLVGDPKVLKQATQHISAAIVGAPTPVKEEHPCKAHVLPRMDPSRRPYRRVASQLKTLLAVIEEQRIKNEENFASLETQMEASKNTTIKSLEEASDRQTKHEISMQQAIYRVETTTKAQSEGIEPQMTTQFAKLFAELTKMQGGKEQKDTKRSPAPSPDAAEPNKSAKTY